jgi:hypothetical protein
MPELAVILPTRDVEQGGGSAVPRRFSAIACIAAFAVLLGSSVSSGAAKTGFAALVGKRLPGAPKTWLPIANPYTHPVDVAGSSTPPLVTFGTGQEVDFFEFRTSKEASAFYSNPPLAARMVTNTIQGFESLAGATGIPGPSRWLGMRDCAWSSGPATGELSGGTINAAGKCSAGAPGFLGFAIIMQRGTTVAIAHTISGGPLGIGIQAAGNATVVAQNKALASHASELMKSVGLS